MQKNHDFIIKNGVLKEYKGSESNIIIPENVKKIGSHGILNGAFENCFSMVSVQIPDSVTDISINAFKNCKNLISIEIPDSVKTISGISFENCKSLTSVAFCGKNIYIYPDTFKGCSSLKEISFPEGASPHISKGAIPVNVNIIYHKIEFVIKNGVLKKYNGNEKNVIIPNNVKKIGGHGFLSAHGAFENRSDIISVQIPDGVTDIAMNAFQNCTSLISIEIPKSVKSISISAFENCLSLTSVVIQGKTTSVHSDAFKNCTSLKEVFFPEGMAAYIAKGAIPENSKIIYKKHRSAFVMSQNIVKSEDFIIQDGILTDYQGNGGDIVMPSTVRKIEKTAFFNCKTLNSIVIPEGVLIISDYAFCFCTNLKSVVIPNTVSVIGKNAFSHCDHLQFVSIPNSVTSIETGAFSFCGQLESVILPEHITKIEQNAFLNCFHLKEVILMENTDISIILGVFPAGTKITIQKKQNSVCRIIYSFSPLSETELKKLSP